MNGSMKRWMFAVVSAFLALPLCAQQQITHTVTLPPAPVPSQLSAALPAFDPSLGVLRTVNLELSGAVSGTLSFENTDTAATQAPTYNVVALILGTYPGGNFNPAPNPAFEFAPVFPPVTLGAFDGTIDYAGSSGITIPFQHASGTGVPDITYTEFHEANLAPWIGPAGAPGTVGFSFSPIDQSGGFVPPNMQQAHAFTLTVTLDVHYLYDPLPASICIAAPWSGCPCSNPGLNGGGCQNSADTQGGRLSISGSASLSNDTLQLVGSHMTNSSALYFQGTTFHYVQTPFGDGLRCVSGLIARLGTKLNAGGTSMYPAAGDPSVSVRGGVTTPGMRYYQTYYRDAQSFCTSSTYNITSGYAIQWTP